LVGNGAESPPILIVLRQSTVAAQVQLQFLCVIRSDANLIRIRDKIADSD
jgi:hypothetical protein